MCNFHFSTLQQSSGCSKSVLLCLSAQQSHLPLTVSRKKNSASLAFLAFLRLGGFLGCVYGRVFCWLVDVDDYLSVFLLALAGEQNVIVIAVCVLFDVLVKLAIVEHGRADIPRLHSVVARQNLRQLILRFLCACLPAGFLSHTIC